MGPLAPLRAALARLFVRLLDHALALALSRITQSEIEHRYRRLARKDGLREPRGGAVTAMQRSSSDLRTNLHVHELPPDGAYGVDADGQRRFFTAPAPTPAEVERILARIVRRARARLAELDGAALDEDELALAQTLDATARAHDACWAALMRHAFGVDPPELPATPGGA